MPFCGNCGATQSTSGAFCPNCGNPFEPVKVAAATAEPHTQTSAASSATRTIPPPAQATSPAPPLLPKIDWRRLLVGNWLGAGVTALSVLGVTLVLSGALALMAKPEDFGLGNTLTLATLIAAGAFGADMTADARVVGSDANASLGMFPLTVTVLALATGVIVFRRVIARYPGAVPAVADAVRASAIFGLGLLVPTLLFHSDNDELGRGWGGEMAARNLDMRATVGANSFAALSLGFVIVLVVLLSTVMLRRDWWPTHLHRAHDWVVAPFYGIATTLVLLPFAGIVGLLAIALFGENTLSENDPTGDDTMAMSALVIALLANGGAWLLGLGSGASVGYRGQATDSPGESNWEHLWGTITDDEPGLWIAPVVVLVVFLVSALAVAHRVQRRDRVLGSLGVWAASFLIVTPILVRLSGGHAHFELVDAGRRVRALNGDDYSASAYFGLNGVQATFFMFFVALLVALAVAWRCGGLDLIKARRFFSAIQADPGRSARTAETESSPAAVSATSIGREDGREAGGAGL